MKRPKLAKTSRDTPIEELARSTNHRTLAIWAADCVERVLPYFEDRYQEDNRPRRAIEALRIWIRTGDLRWPMSVMLLLQLIRLPVMPKAMMLPVQSPGLQVRRWRQHRSPSMLSLLPVTRSVRSVMRIRPMPMLPLSGNVNGNISTFA